MRPRLSRVSIHVVAYEKNQFPTENRSPVCQPVAILCTGHTFVFLAFSLPKEDECAYEVPPHHLEFLISLKIFKKLVMHSIPLEDAATSFRALRKNIGRHFTETLTFRSLSDAW